jgi:hypothetical protein
VAERLLAWASVLDVRRSLIPNNRGSKTATFHF